MSVRIFLLCWAIFAGTLAAQEAIVVGSEVDHYVRLLELDGKVQGTPLVYRSSSLLPRDKGLIADTSHLWAPQYPLRPKPGSQSGIRLTVLPLESGMVYNSAFPRSLNDGALWAGKGVSAVASGGAQITWGPLTGRLYPTLVYAQNRVFALAPLAEAISGRSNYSYPWEQVGREIDWPQRFGESSLQRVDLGQSSARLDLDAFTAGLSTENLWWGPAFRNAIIMGNSAAGFPHIDMGTGRPVRTPIGELELRSIWGRLTRSSYFGTGSTDGRRLISGLTLGYRPGFLPGLTLGVTRVQYQEWPPGGLTLRDVLAAFGGIFNDYQASNDPRDQIASLTARWVLVPAEFEAYFEWARNDFARFLRDFILEPDHSQAYTIGFQKSLRSGRGRWRLSGEVTTLGVSPSILYRAEPTLYMHHIVVEGYTNEGQLLGAGIGPGSNSQYLGVDRYSPQGRWGLFLERVRYDDDALFFGVLRRLIPTYANENHQVDLTVGASAVRFVRGLEIGASLELTHEYNRYFQREADETNLKWTVTAKWMQR